MHYSYLTEYCHDLEPEYGQLITAHRYASRRICALFIAYYMCVLVNSFVSKLFEFELYSAEY